MISRIETIEEVLKKRKRRRAFIFLMAGLIPCLGLWFLMTERSSKMPYVAAVPAVSIANNETKKPVEIATTIERSVDTMIARDTLVSTPSENASIDTQAAKVSQSQAGLPEISTPLKAKTVEEKAKVVEEEILQPKRQAAGETVPYYISMPAYEAWSLKRKMDLMRNSAYSPSEKTTLRKHITNLFVNRSRARVSVIDQNINGKPETRSYPIGMYLDRLNKNPKVQFRLVEKVSENGRLSGLVVKE